MPRRMDARRRHLRAAYAAAFRMTHQWLKYDRSGSYAQRRIKAVGMLRRARRLALDGYRTMAVRPHEGCFGRHYSDYTDYRHPVTKRIMRITPSGMKDIT